MELAEHLKNHFTTTFGIRPVVHADKEYVTAYGPEVWGQMNGVLPYLFSEIESVELKNPAMAGSRISIYSFDSL
jgi:hypothetical protein